MANKKIVICDFCFQHINAWTYREHVMFKHKVNLPDLNIEQKIVEDQKRIQMMKDIEEMAKLQSEKKIEKYKLIKPNLNEYSLPPDPFDEIMREINKEHKLKEELREKIKIKKKEEFEEFKSKIFEENTHTYNVIWDYISFDDNSIKINPQGIKAIVKPIYHKGIIKSLNTIKSEYFLRLYSKKIYKLSFFKGEFDSAKSPDWNKIIETIEFAKEYYLFKYSDFKNSGRTKIFNNLSNDEIILLFENLFARSSYLKYLASLQSKEFPIIPVLEYSNKNTEESFIFRFISKSGKIIIIWENVNDSRASHVFVLSKEKHDVILPLIEDFICTKSFDIKRSLLHGDNFISQDLKQKLNYHSGKRHIGLPLYKSEIKA